MNKHASHTDLEAKLRKLGDGLKIEAGLKEDLRSHVLGQIVTTPRKPKKNTQTRWLYSWSPALAILLVVITSSTAVLASKAIPGDPLYPVEQLVEKIEISLVRDEIAKAKLYASLSEKRVAELEALDTQATPTDEMALARWQAAKAMAQENVATSLERLNQVQAVVLEKYENEENPHKKDAYLKLSKSLQQVIDRKARRAQTLEEILKETADSNKAAVDSEYKMDDTLKKDIREQVRREFKADEPKKGDLKASNSATPSLNAPPDMPKGAGDLNKKRVPGQNPNAGR